MKDNYLIDMFKMFADPYDMRSEILGALFSVCDWLYDHDKCIPDEWEYCRGNGSSDTDAYWYREMTHPGITGKAVLRFGKYLHEEYEKLPEE